MASLADKGGLSAVGTAPLAAVWNWRRCQQLPSDLFYKGTKLTPEGSVPTA